MNQELLTLEPVAWFLRGGLLVAASLLVGAGMRRRSAAWLAFFWRSVMVVMLALAGITLIGWKPSIVWPSSLQETIVEAPLAGDVTEDVAPPAPEGDLSVMLADPAIVSTDHAKPFPWPLVVWIVWGLGAVVVIGRWIGALVRRRQLAEGAMEWKPDGSWLALPR